MFLLSTTAFPNGHKRVGSSLTGGVQLCALFPKCVFIQISPDNCG